MISRIYYFDGNFLRFPVSIQYMLKKNNPFLEVKWDTEIVGDVSVEYSSGGRGKGVGS